MGEPAPGAASTAEAPTAQRTLARFGSFDDSVGAITDTTFRTNGDGTFFADEALPPGRYLVRVGQRDNPTPDEVTVGTSTGDVALELVVDTCQAPMRIDGTVVDKTGAPIAGVEVLRQHGISATFRALDDHRRRRSLPPRSAAGRPRCASAAVRASRVRAGGAADAVRVRSRRRAHRGSGVTPFQWNRTARGNYIHNRGTDGRGVVEFELSRGDYDVQPGDLGEQGTTIGTAAIAPGQVTDVVLRMPR